MAVGTLLLLMSFTDVCWLCGTIPELDKGDNFLQENAETNSLHVLGFLTRNANFTSSVKLLGSLYVHLCLLHVQRTAYITCAMRHQTLSEPMDNI